MKTEIKNILGFNVPVVGIAETLQEAITAAGSEEAVLKDFNNNVLAHSHYTILRRAIGKKLQEVTGIKFKTEKDGDKDVVVEKDSQYIARLEEELGEDVLKTHEAAIAGVCQEIAVDYKPGTRGSGGSATPAKKWLAFYDQLVEENKLSAFCAKNEIDTNTDEETLRVTVANKVKDIVTAKMEAAAKEALG